MPPSCANKTAAAQTKMKHARNAFTGKVRRDACAGELGASNMFSRPLVFNLFLNSNWARPDSALPLTLLSISIKPVIPGKLRLEFELPTKRQRPVDRIPVRRAIKPGERITSVTPVIGLVGAIGFEPMTSTV